MKESKGGLNALICTARSDNAIDLAAELVQRGAGALLDSDAIEKVPFLGWAVSLYRISETFQKQRMARNCNAMLQGMSNTSSDSLDFLKAELEKDPEKLDDFIDTTMTVILESKKAINARAFGRLLAARASNSLAQGDFDAIAVLIVTGTPLQFEALRRAALAKRSDPHNSHSTKRDDEAFVQSLGVGMRIGTNFSISDLGFKFYDICLG